MARAQMDRLVDELDVVYTTNQLMHLCGVDTIDDTLIPTTPLPELDALLDDLLEECIVTQTVDDALFAKEEWIASVMNLFTPLPSVVNEKFWQAYEQSPIDATNYFFELSKKNRYIQTRAIAKNIHFPYQGKYGTLEVTINLSKPEKDPKAIALARQSSGTQYPTSQLTMTNEGYYGRYNHPARSNHRIIRLTLGEEPWGFQYSPYAYFNEHSIFLSQQVRPMKVDHRCFAHLLEIIKKFPHYFVGSNAGIPIVGGSILSHDHYQAGRHIFPMDHASVMATYKKDGFDGTLERLYWPLSVIRLRSSDKNQLLQMADRVLTKWEDYSNADLEILSHTNGELHNAITPIARRKGDAFEFDLVLRNNRTSQQYPDGIFHPHPDVQPIKKENIGLIEVMGLAILPPRLKTELQEVERALLGMENHLPTIHQQWVQELVHEKNITSDTVHDLVQQKVGQIFERVLEDAGVFKQTEEGQAAFEDFIESI